MAQRNFKFSAVLQVSSRSKAFSHKVSTAGEDSVRKVLKAAEKIAKQNVAKGKGPSAHAGNFAEGHNFPYEDTGNLGENIQSAVWLQGFLTQGSLFTELDYGSYLEVGWRTKKGNFFRYPWMKPAFMEAMRLLPKLAAETFRTQLQDLEEETIMSDVSLEDWASRMELWAKDMQAAKGVEKAPEISGGGGQKRKRPRLQTRGSQQSGFGRHGRKPNPELGPKMKGDPIRIRRERKQKKQLAEAIEKVNPKHLGKPSERSTRHTIDPLAAQRRHEEAEQRRELVRLKQKNKQRPIRVQAKLPKAPKAPVISIKPKKKRKKKNP